MTPEEIRKIVDASIRANEMKNAKYSMVGLGVTSVFLCLLYALRK